VTGRFGRHSAVKARGCPRCGAQRAVEVIVQARPVPTRKGTLVTRSRGFCFSCAEGVFERIERILDETKAAP